jgi:hypothetical protein
MTVVDDTSITGTFGTGIGVIGRDPVLMIGIAGDRILFEDDPSGGGGAGYEGGAKICFIGGDEVEVGISKCWS